MLFDGPEGKEHGTKHCILPEEVFHHSWNMKENLCIVVLLVSYIIITMPNAFLWLLWFTTVVYRKRLLGY